jgi:hypothetical protein
MGGHANVDLTQLRTVADRVLTAAQTIAERPWPTLDPGDMEGSAVAGIVAPELVAARLTEVVADMRDWAVAAHMAADAFERAESHNTDRLDQK